MTPLPRSKAALNIKSYAPSTLKTLSAVALLSFAIAGCGGGGGGVTAPSPNPPPPPSSGLESSSKFAQQCIATTGNYQQERNWVRSYVDEAYLWYRDVPNLNPLTSTATPQAFFDSLTVDGVPSKDKFSFTFDTVAWDKRINSGVTSGYGVDWVVLSPPRTLPRIFRAAYTQPNSPASRTPANLQRGATIVAINGVSINDNTQPGIDVLIAGLAPSGPGISNTFTVQDTGAATTRTFQMTSADVVSSPVLNVSVSTINGVKFGYILFNDHLASAEPQLISAINQLKAAGVQELILDLRYNGGGYLYIASQLGYMISTPAVAGRVFEKLRYNDKRVADNNRSPELFLNTTTSNAALPQLGLSRLYVLTTGGTCSASESIMNGLRPFVNVVQIGSTTCGKPYGFTAKDNCGTSYFPIEFEGVNDAGQGGYSSGFTPGTTFVGCSATDDLDHALTLDNPIERMLSTAITHRLTGSCPTVAVGKESVSNYGQLFLRDEALQNKYLKPQ
jgi:hypothetical protein